MSIATLFSLATTVAAASDVAFVIPSTHALPSPHHATQSRNTEYTSPLSGLPILPTLPTLPTLHIIPALSTASSSTRSSTATHPSCLWAYRGRGGRSNDNNEINYQGGRNGGRNNRNSAAAGGSGGGGGGSRQRETRDYDAFGDYEDDYDDDYDNYNYGGTFEDDDDEDEYYDDYYADDPRDNNFNSNKIRNDRSNNMQEHQPQTPAPSAPPPSSSTFYSQKPLSDPSFTLTNQQQLNDNDTHPNKRNTRTNKLFFQQLCQAAKITRPSRIQSLAWPTLLQGEHAVVADQTGSGKTLAYLLPLLQRLHLQDVMEEERARSESGESGASKEGGGLTALTALTATQRKKKKMGTPRIVILTPTAELADQIHAVCTSLHHNLALEQSKSNSPSQSIWNFHPFVTTATGSHTTNIRDQIRMLQSTPIDILISTPGRLATILRTKNAGLDLGHVISMVLDEVDFLLVDETFGPQLRTVGVAVQSGADPNADDADDADESNINHSQQPQFIFVTATLPTDVLTSIQTEFPTLTTLRGPGLHRLTPSVHQTLVDVSVPATSNRDPKACFDVKVHEMLKALRKRRCKKTLVFCNTVESCRMVENALRRSDRRRKRSRVWAYHNALSSEVRLKNLKLFSQDGGEDGGMDGMDGMDRSSTGEGAERILVCTDRAARGIDFNASPIDHVLLFDFPKDPAEYVRRVGRTARAGRAGASTVLAYGWQLPIARQIMGLGGGEKGKGKGGAKLESFTMMKSSDGWGETEEEMEDEFYMKGGAKRRKEMAMGGGAGGGGRGGGGRKKNPWERKSDGAQSIQGKSGRRDGWKGPK